MAKDSISRVPGDIMKIIFGALDLEDQIRLASTCVRFHTFPWLTELWKSQSIPVWEKNVPFPIKRLFTAIEKIPQLHWKKVAKSLASGSFKIEFEMDEQREIVPASVTLGEFEPGKSQLKIRKNDIYQYGDWVIDGKGEGIQLCQDKEYIGSFKDKFFNGKGKINYKNGIKYEGKFRFGWRYGKGTMTWPDGFTYEGQWKEDSPIDLVDSIHPAIEKCVKKNQCTKKVTQKNELVPQLMAGNLCQTCVSKCHKCQDGEDHVEPRWVRFGHCKCQCQVDD
jgi:hypothetical protein